MPDLKEFGILGFHRLNRYNNSKKAFKRTHIYSTVLLNLDKLWDVDYHWRAHAMEDIQFNRDANRVGAVLCKCYRFAFSSPQIKKGGCSYMKACNEELRKGGGAIVKPAPAPAPADPGASKGKEPELPPEKLVIPVKEGSTVADQPAPASQNTAGAAEVPMWLREGMQEHEIAGFTETMQLRGFSEPDLKFFKDEALKEAGVESAITRARMLRRIHDHFKR
jgi:hypothetical protein